VQARQLLAEAFLLSNNPAKAEQQYRSLTEVDPRNSTAWHGLGRTYEALARDGLAQLSETAPDSPQMLVLAGDSRLKSRQHGAAFLFYKQAVEKAPNMRGLHAALAEVYKRTGHDDWARTAELREATLGVPDCTTEKLACDFAAGRLRDVIRAESDTAEALFWKITAWNELAAQAFAQLLTLPDSPEAHELRAEIHTNQRRYPEAVAELEQAVALSPGNRRIGRAFAASLHRASDFERARAVLESLITVDRDSASLHYLLGDTYLNLQQPQQAITHLEHAVKLEPGVLAAHAALGRAYLQNQQAQHAIPHLQEALSSDEDGAIHYQLASAYRSTRQSELARETLKKYSELAEADRKAKAEVEQQAQITGP
jgi:predicted Zn-dependent protease